MRIYSEYCKSLVQMRVISIRHEINKGPHVFKIAVQHVNFTEKLDIFMKAIQTL